MNIFPLLHRRSSPLLLLASPGHDQVVLPVQGPVLSEEEGVVHGHRGGRRGDSGRQGDACVELSI